MEGGITVVVGVAAAPDVQHEAVVDQLEAVLLGDIVLQALDLVAGELDDVAGLDADHVVVMLAVVELEHRVTALEVVAGHQAGGLELRQHTVDRGQTDFLTRIQQVLVNVLGTQVPIRGILEDLKDLQARQRDLEAGLA